MPLYRCIAPPGTIAMEDRPKIAKAFTDVHCEVTGAPRDFVHVFFYDRPSEDQAPGRLPYFIDGANRAGRLPEAREQILAGVKKALSEIAGVSLDQISGRITEAPASWMMEAGEILPEPGKEGAEWFAHSAANQ